MNESRLIEIIKKAIGSDYIGDDCAYLEDLGIVISQDSLVEDVHFSLKWMTPRELGIKSVLVNISDIFASGAKPSYLTISLSLPSNFSSEFVEDFYEGVQEVCSRYGVKVVGGDLTGGDKVFVSICIIGKTTGRKIASRANAKQGYSVYTCGSYGSSAAGLRLLKEGKDSPKEFIIAHKTPILYEDFATNISTLISSDYAMMDTSDGLADALFKIAVASNLSIEIDFDKVPIDSKIKQFDNWENLVLFGGEDYGLVAVIPNTMEFAYGTLIGYALEKKISPLIINKDGKRIELETIDDFTFNHFA